MSQISHNYLQVLHRLQRLRGDLLNQRCSALEVDAELDGLWLSIEQDQLLCKLEAQKIHYLLRNFRSAVVSVVNH